MKILVVCQYYYPEPFRVHELCEAFVQQGHQVSVLTGVPNYPMGNIPDKYKNRRNREEVIHGVHVIRVPLIPRKPGKLGLAANYCSFAICASAKALFLKNAYDVILVYQLSPVVMTIPALILKKRLGKKLLLYCLDLWPESMNSLGVRQGQLLYDMMLHASKWIYQKTDYIAITSKMFEQYFRNRLGIKDKHFTYLPQFAEDVFSNVASDSHEGINLIYAGNVGEMQSVETIIRAAAESNDEAVKWHIVGDGSALLRCKELARELNVEHTVVFHGRLPVEKMPDFYAKADAMLVTLAKNETISYTLPGKIQSYMAAGKPIIVSADGEPARTVLDAACGYVACAENASDLNLAVNRFIREGKAAELGRNARRYYDDHFTKRKNIDDTLGILQLLANS